ncbi:Hypothetical predicted protein [Olea europaea subsp. europaea]|uniref:Uncharacterized protein n=1 Tax=Olea europaea subsp. europaea TaxID=158383 RepID=A0A8S0QG55_OLEEU|nr:Hypothetical predicted protein [Olea europaea subsp. europaea]
MTKRKEKGDERVKRPTPIYLHLTPPTHLLLFAPICSAITRPSAKLHVGVGNIREHGEGEERVKRSTPTCLHLTPPPHLLFSHPDLQWHHLSVVKALCRLTTSNSMVRERVKKKKERFRF